MPRETLAELKARIAELEDRNDALATRIETLADENATLATRAAAPPPPPVVVTVAPAPARPRRPAGFIGRQILAGVLVVLGVVLTPVALVLQFAQQQVTDTEVFVATYAPLAEQPEVQQVLTDAITEAVTSSLPIDEITRGVIAGIQTVDPTRLSLGLNLFEGQIVEGINGLIRLGVESVVTAEWFPEVWEQTLRFSHAQLNATLRGDPSSIATINGDDFGLQLGPVVAYVKDYLLNSGFSVASAIPDDLDIAVPIGTVTGLGQVKTFYSLGLAVGTWLPIVAAALLVAGIAVAPRRRSWVMGTSIALGVVAVLIGITLGLGRSTLTSLGILTPESLGLVFDAATAALGATLLAIGAIAVIGIVAAWLAGPSRPARAARRGLEHFPSIARDRLALTNPFSRFLERYRDLVYWIIIAAVILTIVFFRPLTIWVVIVAVVAAAILLLIAETFRASTVAPVEADSPAEPAPVGHA